MNKQIIQALRELGVPAHLEGYEYIKMELELCLDKKSAINAMTKGIYPTVANCFDTTPARVERATRHAIETAWERGNTDILHHYFGNTVSAERGKPTNAEFIATVAETLRMEQEEGGTQ